MSLATLVAFAQASFGSLSEHTRDDGSGNEDQPDAIGRISTDALLPRQGLPGWVRQRTAEQEVPSDGQHPWRIERPITPQRPPPDVNALGADALAYYAPFHFYREGWGIFIRQSGVVYLAEFLKGEPLQEGDEQYLDVAENILLQHEWHHAATEIACTRAELTARRPVYQPYFSNSAAAEHEEALANARAISWVFRKDPLGVRPRAELWMRGQGPGYRDYSSWLSARSFSGGINKAAVFMADILPKKGPRADSSLHTFLFRGTYLYQTMPVTRVIDPVSKGVGVLRPFPKEYGVRVLVHTNEHPPPHIHVQVLSGGEETRYAWPELRPLPKNKPLPGPAEKNLKLYVDKHGTDIGAKLSAVYGKPLGRGRGDREQEVVG